MFNKAVDILKGILLGILTTSIVILIIPTSIMLYNYIDNLGGITYVALLIISYILAYSWPILLIISVLWFSNFCFRRFIIFPR